VHRRRDLTKDRRGVIVDWNSSAERLYGNTAGSARCGCRQQTLDVTVSRVRDAADDMRRLGDLPRPHAPARDGDADATPRDDRDSSLDPIFTVTLDDEVISWNAARPQMGRL
jgi:hypothetical protein